MRKKPAEPFKLPRRWHGMATGTYKDDDLGTLARWSAVPVWAISLAGFAYYVLERSLIAAQGREGRLKMAVGAEIKGWTSVGVYLVGILVALFWMPYVALALYALVALMWLVPDKRIERALDRAG